MTPLVLCPSSSRVVAVPAAACAAAKPVCAAATATARAHYDHARHVLGPDLQNILRQSYDYLTTMTKLRSTYDGLLIYNKHLTMNGKLFIGKISRAKS